MLHHLATLALVAFAAAACDNAGFGGGGGKSGTASGDKKKVSSEDPQEGKTKIPVGSKAKIDDLLDGATKVKACSVKDETIAKCDPKTGEIIGLKPGETVVTVKLDDGTEAPITVVVTEGKSSTDKGSGTGGPGSSTGTAPGGIGAGTDAGSGETILSAVDLATGGNAGVVFENTENGIRRELFNFGGDAVSPLVDFVIVLDNSGSMEDIATKTAAGFVNLASSNGFPPKALVAVMTTMASERDDYSKTHPAIDKYPFIHLEPGFLDFVDKDAIETYKGSVAADKAARWRKAGCGKWFKADEKNADDEYCMSAHTQSTFFGVGAEPGINAVHQLFLKHQGKKLFRKGAIVNFVFVTDTHDPGTPTPGDLVTARPTLDQIREAAKVDNDIAGLRFHGLVPEKPCTEEKMYDKSYFPLIEATQGATGDPCASDYAEILQNVSAAAAKPETGVFALSKPATEVVTVLVDGTATTAFTINADKDTLTVPDLDPAKSSKIEIIYRFQ